MTSLRALLCAILLLTVVSCGEKSPPPATDLASYRLLAEDAPPPTPVPTIAPTPAPVPSTAARRSLRPSASKPAVPGPVVPQSVPQVAAGSVQQRIVAAWPGDDAKVLRVVGCETGGTFNPMIKSRTGKYWGLAQADADFRASYGWAGWGVEEQMAMMWRGYKARGWGPWPRCGKR